MEVRITLCRQLRVQIFDQTRTCIACNTSLKDTPGDHALRCSTYSDRIARHSYIRDFLFHACRSTGLSPVSEGPLRVQLSTPGDIFTLNWVHGSIAAVDGTLTCLLQSTVINRAAEEVGYACKLVVELKFAAFAELYHQKGFEFIHLASKTKGGFGSSATKSAAFYKLQPFTQRYLCGGSSCERAS